MYLPGRAVRLARADRPDHVRSSDRRRRVALVGADDLLPQRGDADEDELDVGEAEGDADDGAARQDDGHQAADGQPQAGQQEPVHVQDERVGTGVWLGHRGPPERPQGVVGQPEGGHAERDGDHEDAHHHVGEARSTPPSEVWR